MEEDSIPKKSFCERLLEKMAGLKSKKPPSRDEKYRTTLMNLDDYLAQPEEDSKIGSKLKQLQNYIHAHAKYYHDRPVSLSKEEILALLTKRLFKSDREAAWRLAYCIFENPSHRETFIRLIISKAICMGIDFNGNADISLLPKEIVLFMTAFKETPRSKETTQVDEVALCEWRRLGMFLLSNPKSKAAVQLRNSNLRIEAMLDSLDEILSPFAEPEHSGEDSGRRVENLRRILEMGAEFGVLLFGQPCGWELSWTVRPSDENIPKIEVVEKGVLPQSSNVPEKVLDPEDEQSPAKQIDSDPQSHPPKRKRRNRLGRSQSTKEKSTKKAREQSHGKIYPPSTWETQNIDSYILQNTTTGGSHVQDLHQQRLQPSQSNHRPPLSLRSRSESNLSATNHQGSSLPGTIQSGVKTHDPHSRNYRVEDEAPAPLPKDGNLVTVQPNDYSAKLPERPNTRSGESHPETSFLYGPEESTETSLPDPPKLTRKPIMYFPALLKIKDEYGCNLSQWIVVSEPAVDRTFLTHYV